MKKNIAASSVSLPRLPKSKGTGGSTGSCLCGCKQATGSRFVPGHDATLLAWALRVEKGLVKEAPAPHTHNVAVEIKLRKAAGLTGQSHTKALINASNASAKAEKVAKSAPKARLVKKPVVAPVVDVPVGGDSASQ